MDELKSRFDGLPLHRFCFYHTHPTMGYNDGIAWLDNYIRQTPPPAAEYSATETDCLGMTPLHTLACSGVHHDTRLYQRIYNLNPDALKIQDEKGRTVVDYILLTQAPPEIFDFFLDSMRKKWGEFPFDFEELVFRLSRSRDDKITRCRGEELLRKLIQAQRTYFPDFEVGWSSLADTLRWCGCSIGVYRLLVEASLSSRSTCMSKEHERDINFRVATSEWKKFRTVLTSYIKSHEEQLLNVTTQLELALWKVLLDETGRRRQVKENCVTRANVRLNGGQIFQVVIPNVFSFLIW